MTTGSANNQVKSKNTDKAKILAMYASIVLLGLMIAGTIVVSANVAIPAVTTRALPEILADIWTAVVVKSPVTDPAFQSLTLNFPKSWQMDTVASTSDLLQVTLSKGHTQIILTQTASDPALCYFAGDKQYGEQGNGYQVASFVGIAVDGKTWRKALVGQTEASRNEVVCEKKVEDSGNVVYSSQTVIGNIEIHSSDPGLASEVDAILARIQVGLELVPVVSTVAK